MSIQWVPGSYVFLMRLGRAHHSFDNLKALVVVGIWMMGSHLSELLMGE